MASEPAKLDLGAAAAELDQELRAVLRRLPPRASDLRALAEHVAAVPARDVARLDQLLRRQRGYLDPAGTEAIATLARTSDGWGALVLCLSCASGFTREAALRALVLRADSRSLPFVIVRLNDWVATIRQLALAVLESFLSVDKAPALLACLPMFLALERRRRADHSAIVARVVEILRLPASRRILLAGCCASDGELRSACLRLAGGLDDDELVPLLGQSLAAESPAVRLWAMRHLSARPDGPYVADLARAALRDRNARVRRWALPLVLRTATPAAAREHLEGALLDTNTAARWDARVLVLARAPFDLAAFYRGQLDGSPGVPRTAAALRGLGESGDDQDVARVTSYLGASSVRIRRAAVRALRDLLPERTTAPFLSLLCDAQPGVSRDAAATLEARMRDVTRDELARIIANAAAPVHARRAAVRLAAALSKWQSISLLLRVVSGSEPALRDLALVRVRRWLLAFNGSFVQPGREELDEALAALAAASPGLDAALRTQLSFVFESL